MQYSLCALQARSAFVLGVFPFEGNFSVFSSTYVVGVTHPAPVSRCMCSPGNGLHFPWRSGCQRYPGVCQAGTSPTPARPGRPRRALSEAPPPSRCDRVPAGLRTVKLIVPPGTGRGLRQARGCRWAQPHRKLKWDPAPPKQVVPPPRVPRVRAPLPSPPIYLAFAVSGSPKRCAGAASKHPRQRHGKYCLLNSRLYLSSTAPLGVIGQTHNKTQK